MVGVQLPADIMVGMAVVLAEEGLAEVEEVSADLVADFQVAAGPVEGGEKTRQSIVDMKIEEFTEKIKEALGDSLISLIIYGSNASNEESAPYSDINTLVVAEQLGMVELKRLAASVKSWIRKGQPAPLLFTRDRLLKSADVFPIELLDIKERHKVVTGEDVLDAVPVDVRHLRFQVEHELKGKLLHLRDDYLLTENKPKRIIELLVQSLSTFQVLFRAALRLYELESGVGKSEAVTRLANHIPFDSKSFAELHSIKMGTLSPKQVDAEDLFSKVLHSVATIADAVDALEN